MFDKDLQEQPFEEEFPPVQFKMQISTKMATNHPLSPTPFFGTIDNSFDQFQTSLQKELYKHNANLIKKSLIAYLKYCINAPIDQCKVFQNGKIFAFENQDILNQDNSLDSIINNSMLLTNWKRKQIIDIFNQYVELHGLFKQLTILFGKTITQEFLYILDLLLQAKLQKFKSLYNCELDDLIPRMERFWGDQNNQTIFKGGWNVYTEIDYTEVKTLAQENIETQAQTIFFSKHLKCLNLASVSLDCLNEVSLIDKFINLVSFISSTFFLTMAGICQKGEDLDQFCSDLHYCTNKEGRLQEQHLQKRIKNQ